jgi:hypothetical protein
MPVLPHNFPTLRRAGAQPHRRSIITIGAGMSVGIIPMPQQLLASKRAKAEATLHHTASAAADDLYKWADEILAVLIGRSDPVPKLTLAQSLDIPTEPRWLGNISTYRTTPRHRVIARFAREGLWDQIWSLNWDCLQEAALENVGIERNGVDAQLPWPTCFSTFILAEDCAQMGEEYRVKVIKPHGCVTALIEAELAKRAGNDLRARQLSSRFLITASELANVAAAAAGPEQDFIFASLCMTLCTKPLVIAGWSASEKYLLDYVEQHVRPVLLERPIAVDELSVIDIVFRPGHSRLAGYYNKGEHDAHIGVDVHDFTTDKLFLWIQALYGLSRLHGSASAADQAALTDIVASVTQPPDVPIFVIDWIDSFLPVWVRLCWRCGLVECRTRQEQSISIDDIDLESRDEHIPWSIPFINRPDLAAAAALIATLHRSRHGDGWDYSAFPGGFYRDNGLVIPLPAWHTTPPNDLRGLKALINAIKQPGAGYIESIYVLPISLTPPVADDTKRILKELVARELSMARFARGDDIGNFTLAEL